MPQTSSTDATFHDAQDLIYALQTTSSAIALVNLGNGHKEALITLLEYESEVIEREKLLKFYRARSSLSYTRV